MNTSIRWRRLPGALWLLYRWQAIAVLWVIGGLALWRINAAPTQVPRYEAAATSITPITSYSDGASGLTFSGDAYDVTCTVSTDTVTLYAAMHDGTSWRVYDATSCTLAVGSGRTCRFPAEKQTGQTWNAYKTGTGTVASCTAKQAFGPLVKRQPSGGTTPAADPWADIPLVLRLAADEETGVANGATFSTLTDQSSVKQHLTVTGSLTMNTTGGPGSTPCYVFPSGAYATRTDATMPGAAAAPGYAVLAVVYLTDLSGYPEVFESGLPRSGGGTGNRSTQHAIGSDGSLYSASTGGGNERWSNVGVVTINTWTIVSWRFVKATAFSSTNPAYAVNGTIVAQYGGSGTDTPAWTRDQIELRVGANQNTGGAGQFLLGRIAELAVLSTSDAAVLATATTILKTKYSL